MYVPKHFAIDDPQLVVSFMRAQPFGILVSQFDGKPVGTHVPFVVLASEPNILLGTHIARTNQQWTQIEGADALAIFHGAHAHISGAWYEEPGATVPTWDYSAIHCSGQAQIADPGAILEQLVRENEGPNGWNMASVSAEYLERMMQAIVGITIAVQRTDAQFKYSQNRTEEDRRRVLEHLARSSDANAQQLGADMIAFYSRDDSRPKGRSK